VTTSETWRSLFTPVPRLPAETFMMGKAEVRERGWIS